MGLQSEYDKNHKVKCEKCKKEWAMKEFGNVKYCECGSKAFKIIKNNL